MSQELRQSHADQRKECSKRCVALVNEGQSLLSENSIDAALVKLSSALKVEPGRVGVIHQIGHCLERMGASEDAALCYRGVIPDSLNLEYFDSELLSNRVKMADQCEDVQVLPAYIYDSIKLTAPRRNPSNKNKYGQFNYTNTEARANFCTIASGGKIWFDGFNTVALNNIGNVLSEHTKGNEFLCLHACADITPIAIEGTVCFLDARSSNIYYHWMLDVLPKLGVLEKSGIALESIDYFIVNAKSSYQLETLKAFGICSDRIVSTAVPQYYSADRMVIPYLRNDLGDRIYRGLGVGLAQWIPKYLKQHFLLDNYSVKTGTSQAKRIYISRSTRGSRNICNEAEVIEYLELRGFETVEFEDYSVVGQAELMSQSEIVLGVHGAGFTNLSFCKPGTKVVEIFGDYIVPCYWALSAVASLDYSQYMATSVSDESQDTDNPGAMVEQLRNKQIYVEMDEFIAYIDSILEFDVVG